MKSRNGILAGYAILVFSNAPLSAHAKDFAVLHAFAGGTDGHGPAASLLQDSAGNFYGTTGGGGGTGCGGYGCGTVFKIAPDGTETILYAFQGGTDGESPEAALIADDSGNFYGTTAFGGDPDCRHNMHGLGCGTVFELTPDGIETIRHAFAGGKDGSGPGGLAMDQAGNLYGATGAGGSGGKDGLKRCGDKSGCGTVFEIAADGTETMLYAFRGGKDGSLPLGNVVLDGAGNLYGATSIGGGKVCGEGYGCGTIYKIVPGGMETVLYRFKGGSDGMMPNGLIIDGDANLYGTTVEGGAACSCGTVFKVTPDGEEKILYAFMGGNDGDFPYGSLTVDVTGSLYGTTGQGAGGACGGGCGTVFKLAKNDKETVLHAFGGGSKGWFPYGGVIRDAAGDLFGTTVAGGDTNCSGSNGQGCGIVFELKK